MSTITVYNTITSGKVADACAGSHEFLNALLDELSVKHLDMLALMVADWGDPVAAQTWLRAFADKIEAHHDA